RHAMQNARAVDTFIDYSAKINRKEIEFSSGGADSPGAQDLLDRPHETVAIFEHNSIELFPFLFVNASRLQRLEIQPDGCDGSLQLMSDGVNESIVLFIPTNFADKKDGVKNDAADDHEQQQHSEKQQNAGPPVQQNPTDVEQQDYRD